jgi:trigger factor
MLKKSLLFILVAAMLLLSSCRVVEVVDHGKTTPAETTNPSETTAPKTEYTPWGFWYSYDACAAIELTQGSDKVKLYSLQTGYYEYFQMVEADCIFDGDATFTATVEDDQKLTFTFDKYKDTLTFENDTFTRMEKAPTEHLEYVLPNYANFDSSSYITLGDIDFASIASLVFEGAPYNVALDYYGEMKKFPAALNIDRPAQSGDCVKIDYCGKLDGVAFQGGTATDVSLFISDYENKYIPGFTDGIIGHSVGETFDVDVTFPENYHATELAGKAVVFTMTLHVIYDLSLTDEEVEKFGGNDYKTYAEWVEVEELAITKELFSSAVLRATTQNTPLPSEAYLYYYQQTMDYYHVLAYYYGVDFTWLLNYYGMNEMTIMQKAINQATYNMALFILMEQEELSWTEEEFSKKHEALVTKYLENYKDASREEAVAYADTMKNQIELELAEEKVLVWSFGMIFPSENK